MRLPGENGKKQIESINGSGTDCQRMHFLWRTGGCGCAGGERVRAKDQNPSVTRLTSDAQSPPFAHLGEMCSYRIRSQRDFATLISKI